MAMNVLIYFFLVNCFRLLGVNLCEQRANINLNETNTKKTSTIFP